MGGRLAFACPIDIGNLLLKLFSRCLVCVCSLLMSVLGASTALALGLGEIEYRNVLGQPLSARVPVLDDRGDLSPNEIRVEVLSRQRALELGYDHLSASRLIRLEVSKHADGVWVLLNTGAQVVNEPFFNFQLELAWASGTTIREYTLLLDPPSLASSQNGTSTLLSAKPQPESKPKPALSTRSKPTVHNRAEFAGDTWRVQPGDTLSHIVSQLKPGLGKSAAVLQQQLLQRNPRAFINGDPNRILAGAVLQLPSLDAMQASAPVVEPEQVDQPAVETASEEAPAVEKQPSKAGESVPENGMLRLTKDQLLSQEVPNFAELESQPPEVVKAYLDQTQEKIDLVRRDNDDLRQQIERIESSEYLQNLKGMVELQRQQLRELKKTIIERQAKTPTAPVTEVAPEVPWEEKRSTPALGGASTQQQEQAVVNIEAAAPGSKVDNRSSWQQWAAVALALLALVLLALIGLEVWKQKTANFRTQEKPIAEAPIVVGRKPEAATTLAAREDDIDLDDFEIDPEDLSHLQDTSGPMHERLQASQEPTAPKRVFDGEEDWDDLFDAIVGPEDKGGTSSDKKRG